MNTIQAVGKLSHWYPEKAFGFIVIADTFGRFTRYYVHLKQIKTGDPIVGSRAEFIIGLPNKGACLPAWQVRLTAQSAVAVV